MRGTFPRHVRNPNRKPSQQGAFHLPFLHGKFPYFPRGKAQYVPKPQHCNKNIGAKMV